MVDVVDIFGGFIGGLITGLVAQYMQFKHSLRLEKTKRLSPYLEEAYPIVEILSNDSIYAADLQLRDDKQEFERILRKIIMSIRQYAEWFVQFRTDGMMPELDSLDSELLSLLVGMFQHARLCKLHGREYISQQMQDFSGYCGTCRALLENRLSD